MQKEKIKEFMDQINKKAFDMLLEKGGVEPAAFFLKDNNVYCLPLSLSDDNEKDKTRALIEITARKLQAEAVCMVTEAWFAFAKNGILPTEPIRNLPDKKECVVISASDRNNSYFIMTEIVKEGDDITMGEQQSTFNDKSFSASDSFTGFMRDTGINAAAGHA